jgi:hypothetical protein
MNSTKLGYALKLQAILHEANPDREPLDDEIECRYVSFTSCSQSDHTPSSRTPWPGA